mgnify:CR=1 FL=1
MGYYGKSNAANPVLISAQELSAATSAVIFDGVFNEETNHYKLVCVDMTLDDASTDIRIMRRNGGSDVTTTLDFQGHSGNMQSGETTNEMLDQTVGGYMDITSDETGTDGTRHTNHVIIDYFPNVAHLPTDMMQSLTIGVGAYYDDAGDAWWKEQTNVLVGSTSFDGCSISAGAGNIAGGKFYIYGMV